MKHALIVPLVCVQMALGASYARGEHLTPPFNPTELPTAPLRPNKPLSACDLALDACQKVVEAQDASIANLKADVAKLEDKLADSTKTPLLPAWGWFIIGIAAGAAAVTIIHK